MRTIKTILEEMKESVATKRVVSPIQWLDWGLELNILWQDLKSEMTKYEMLYKSEIVQEIEDGAKISQAKLVVESKSENYKTYRYLIGRDKLIEEFIRLAKKRATREEDFS